MNYGEICGLDTHMMICVNDEPFIDDSISGFIDEENDIESSNVQKFNCSHQEISVGQK